MENKNKTTIKLISLSFIIVGGLWVSSWYLIISNDVLNSWSNRGTFGDMFGAINSLFSGLAFALLIVALYLQKEELEETRKELKGQKEQLIKQNENLYQQRFENTFFHLLNFLNDFINSIDVPLFGKDSKGRNSFERFYHKLTGQFANVRNKPEFETFEKKIKASYSSLLSEYKNHLGTYFNNIYNILELIDKSDISNKSYYSNILRSQLSTYEVILLFYHSIGEDGIQIIDLVREYDLCENLERNLLIEGENDNLIRSIQSN